MPIFHMIQQGSLAWQQLRAGIPTASDFDRIVTPLGKLSKSSGSYLHELVAERLMGHAVVPVTTKMMDRGNEMEPEAVAYYEMNRDCEALPVGFVTTDDGTFGASPDRLVGDDGLLEVKCPAPHTHIGYLLLDKAQRDYYPQLQGQLLVTGRAWVDICSYYPGLPTAIVRVERDEKYIDLLRTELRLFVTDLRLTMAKLSERGILPPEKQEESKTFSAEFEALWQPTKAQMAAIERRGADERA